MYKKIANNTNLTKRDKFEEILTLKALKSNNPNMFSIFNETIESLFEEFPNPTMQECFKFFTPNNKKDGFEIKQLDLIFK